MAKLRALDLFCGEGGASAGLARAGFDVTGVEWDANRARRYPFNVVVADVMALPLTLRGWDLIFASPPCQRFSAVSRCRPGLPERHPDLIEPVRRMLEAAGCPWIIENVPGAPIRADVVLTGARFGLDVVRRRHFECSGFPVPFDLLAQHPSWKTTSNGGLATVAGQGAQNPGRSRARKLKWTELPVTLRRRLSERNSRAGWAAAMDIHWMTRKGLAQSIPPAYTEYLGRAVRAAYA